MSGKQFSAHVSSRECLSHTNSALRACQREVRRASKIKLDFEIQKIEKNFTEFNL